jgi:hypothetical protein
MVGWEPFLWAWSANQQVTRTITEALIEVSDSATRQKTNIKQLTIESIFVAEGTATRLKVIQRLLTEITGPTNTTNESFSIYTFTQQSYVTESDIGIVYRLKAIARILATEIVNTAESMARTKGGVKSTGVPITESAVEITESLARHTNKARRPTETSFEDLSFTNTSFMLASVSPDIVNVSDSATAHKLSSIIKTLSETVALGEAISKLVQKVRTYTDTPAIVISDALANIRAKIRAITSELEIESSDNLDFEVITLAQVRTLQESEDIIDDIGTELAKARQIEEPTTAITDLLQGWVNNVPLQIEEHPAPPSSLISGERRVKLRPYERRVRVQLEEEPNTAKAPLKVLAFAHGQNRLQTPLTLLRQPQFVIAKVRVIPKHPSKVARTSLLTTPRLQSLRVPVRVSTMDSIALRKQTARANISLSEPVTQQALEPRKIINIEKRYKTLQLYDLLLILDSIP